MVFFTTDTIDGRYPERYIGMVHGLGFSTEASFAEAVNQANKNITQSAQDNGADAVVAVRYETTTIGKNIIVHVYGTAVKE